MSSEQASDRPASARHGESSLPSLLLLSKSDPLRWALILFKGNVLPRLPKSKPEFRFGKEEGERIRAAFAAPSETAEAEPSELPLTWLGWRDSNPLYRSQSPVCYHYTTSQCSHKPRPAPPASARFQWGGIWGSNPRHPEPQSGALPTELIPPYLSARRTARPIINSKQSLEVVFLLHSPPGEAISKQRPQAMRSLSTPEPNTKPNEVGLCLKGRRRSRM